VTSTSQPLEAGVSEPSTLRDRTIRAVRAEVGRVAMELFLEQGFDKTTVNQIAAAAGMSHTSFFRYFATKEDVVLGHLEELGHLVLGALRARPESESAWQALRHALDLLINETVASPERQLRVARMFESAPSLKIRRLGKQLTWHKLLVPEIARRLHVDDNARDPRPRALVAAALACLNAAVATWIEVDGTIGVPVLLDQAMGALSQAGPASTVLAVPEPVNPAVG
jgi:AcrR family transcriptional regulator